LPIAIHLLVRQHARTLAYPSLRSFARHNSRRFAAAPSRTPGCCCVARRLSPSLLSALAGPILQTPSRIAGYAARVSRAVVVIESADEALISKVTSGAFASATFRREAIADSLVDAVRWLDQQPPSSREIVIAGALRAESVSESDLLAIPARCRRPFRNGPDHHSGGWQPGQFWRVVRRAWCGLIAPPGSRLMRLVSPTGA
jgi:hypothetical protein